MEPKRKLKKISKNNRNLNGSSLLNSNKRNKVQNMKFKKAEDVQSLYNYCSD